MMKSQSKFVVAAALLGVALGAQAGTPVGRWTAGAGGMYTMIDSDRNIDDNYGFNYEFGYALNEKWDATISLFSGNHDDLAPGATWDRELKGITFDFSRVFNRGARFTPFILIGAGLLDQHRPDPVLIYKRQDKDVAGKLGVGMLADLAKLGSTSLQLKGTLVARATSGRDIIDTVATLGLQVAFGAGSN
jgi:hypothetical protein